MVTDHFTHTEAAQMLQAPVSGLLHAMRRACKAGACLHPHACVCMHPCRTLSNNGFSGTLPDAWGWTPKLQLLKNLYLDQNPNLNATLPSAWGSQGGFSSLQVLRTAWAMST